MFAWLLATALLGAPAAAVSSDAAGSKFAGLNRGGQREGDTSAVLSADGKVALSSSSVPMCAEPCDTYEQGVDKTSKDVCMVDAHRTCAPAGCGSSMCLQRFHGECTDHCSEWADATKESFNVCQHKKLSFMCSGQKECPSDTYRCKQKPIDECHVFCEGYEFSGNHRVTMDSEMVCINTDANSANWGTCMPLPCSMVNHSSANYQKTNVCKQAYPLCLNKCAEGSDEHNDTTTCFDEYSETCTNRLSCTEGSLTRCKPRTSHQDLSNVDKEADGWGDLIQSGKSAKEVPKWSAGMTQAEWTKEQQRARIAKQRRMQQKGGKMMRQHREVEVTPLM